MNKVNSMLRVSSFSIWILAVRTSTHLHLHYWRIETDWLDLTDVNSLSLCRQLIMLNLNNNQLTHVRALGTLTQLKNLSIANNQIQSLGEGKTWFLCSWFNVHSTEGLQTCENLEHLNVAGNQLQGYALVTCVYHWWEIKFLIIDDRLSSLEGEKRWFVP